MMGMNLGRFALGLSLAWAGMGGCAAEDHPDAKNAWRDSMHVPLAVRGENAVIRLEFPTGKQTIDPGQFQKDEVCYLKAGEFRIDCFTDGSLLTLGPTDSNDLLTDNPGWNLEPVEEDERARQMMQISAVLALVAGSVDRLPATLSVYIQSPGQHLTQALDLTEKLLTEDRVQLDGFARGGRFKVSIELSDAGREKLEGALDEAGDAPGGVQQVRDLARRARKK
jgi:hypothetical protein